MQRREDVSEAVLSQTDGEVCPEVSQIDHDHGVVVAGMGTLVAIMKIVVENSESDRCLLREISI